jgi:hypothetical protein
MSNITWTRSVETPVSVERPAHPDKASLLPHITRKATNLNFRLTTTV